MEIVTDYLGQAIYNRLTGDADVRALIGTRLYPMTIPQTAELPAAAYQVISQTEIMDHDGNSKLITCRVQFTLQAKSYEAVKRAAQAVANKLRGYKGKLQDVYIESGEILNEFDGWGSIGGVYTTRVDVGIMYRN